MISNWTFYFLKCAYLELVGSNNVMRLTMLMKLFQLLSEAEDIKSILLNTSKSLTLFVPQNHEGSQVCHFYIIFTRGQ